MATPSLARPHPRALAAEIEPPDPVRLAAGLERQGAGPLALLESSLRGGDHGRWSHLAWRPAGAWTWRTGDGWRAFAPVAAAPGAAARAFGEALAAGSANPWSGLTRAFTQLAGAAGEDRAGGATTDRAPDLPPFAGGLALALSYDAARQLDDFQPWPARAIDDLAWPDFDVRLVDTVLALDHAHGRAWLLASTHPAFGRPEPRLEAARDLLARAGAASADPRPGPHPADTRPPAAPASNLTDEEYARAFHRLHEYLRAGDLYQANLTRRFTAPCAQSPLALYARLRERAAAPHAALFTAPWGSAVSASPELFLAREGRRLVTRPIKGTRPRRADPAADRAEAAALQASAKDRAEHVMIVDVHRNDLGRVCEYGSVRVGTLAGLESFPTVHHLVSTVSGRPRAGTGPFAALAAAFPAGSITGAPKKRAIEVIEELEPTRRALYCGGLGFIDLGGDFALNVAIRTILLRDGRAHFQAGGGIVIDSNLESEISEGWDKARALAAAVAGDDAGER